MARALVLVDVAHRMEQAGTQRIGDFMTGSIDGFATLEEAADAIAAYNPHRPRTKDLSGLAKNLRQARFANAIWCAAPYGAVGEGTPHNASKYASHTTTASTAGTAIASWRLRSRGLRARRSSAITPAIGAYFDPSHGRAPSARPRTTAVARESGRSHRHAMAMSTASAAGISG